MQTRNYFSRECTPIVTTNDHNKLHGLQVRQSRWHCLASLCADGTISGLLLSSVALYFLQRKLSTVSKSI